MPDGYSPYGAFKRGREQAGMGWYQPSAAPGLVWMAALAEGASKGAQRGITSAAAEKGGGAVPTTTSTADTGTLGEILTQAQARPPELAAQAVPIESLLAPSGTQVPYRDPLVPLTPASTWADLSLPAPPGAAPKATGGGFTNEQWRRIMSAVFGGAGTTGSSASIWSTRAVKRDIEETDDRRSLREVMQTPVYRYRYLDEPAGTQGRLGPMAEEVPGRWQTPDRHGIKMPVMLGAVMAATRALGRDVQTLKQRLHRG